MNVNVILVHSDGDDSKCGSSSGEKESKRKSDYISMNDHCSVFSLHTSKLKDLKLLNKLVITELRHLRNET